MLSLEACLSCLPWFTFSFHSLIPLHCSFTSLHSSLSVFLLCLFLLSSAHRVNLQLASCFVKTRVKVIYFCHFFPLFFLAFFSLSPCCFNGWLAPLYPNSHTTSSNITALLNWNYAAERATAYGIFYVALVRNFKRNEETADEFFNSRCCGNVAECLEFVFQRSEKVRGARALSQIQTGLYNNPAHPQITSNEFSKQRSGEGILVMEGT